MANTIHIVGNLGDNPALHVFENGGQVCNFPLADSSKFKNAAGELQERVTWHRVSVWGKSAENCKKYLTKGRQVYVTGELQQRVVTDADGKKTVYFQVRATRVEFLQRPKSSQAQTNLDLEVASGDITPETSLETETPEQVEKEANITALINEDVVF